MDDQQQTPPPHRRIRFKGRPLTRHPADRPATRPVDPKSRAELEMEALEQEPETPPPAEEYGMRKGCMGCIWITLLFFAMLIGAVALNCVRV